MSKSEIEKFYNSEEGKEAGLSQEKANELGIDNGRTSARWIMKMKDIDYRNWTSEMWIWAKKQISFIKRMSGNKGSLYDENGNKTRKHTSLLIWGHNPDKFNLGGTTKFLLAPNGKPSNLTPEQYKLVRLPEFKAWFGDWENSPETASKVVDENGEPLICFHATNNDFNVFDEKYIGSSNDRGFYGKGFYFTFQSEFKDMKYAINEASYYGDKIFNCYIKALNPFDFSSLTEYKGKNINLYGTESLVFLYNIANLFPQIADKIFIEKKNWKEFAQEYDFEEVPISILPNLVDKYANDLKYIETIGHFDRKETIGYVKSKIVKYDNTESGGTKGQYEDFEDLGRVLSESPIQEKEIIFIEIAIKKYEGISVRFQPEGYMTRNSIITDAIKEKHDCILQSKYGDELVVFNPNQIKLADGTNTTFDGNNPDIRFAKGGRTKKANSGGDCYQTAGNIALDLAKGLNSHEFIGTPYVVHAEVAGQGAISGVRYGHAWVEDDVFVYDFSNGRSIIFPKQLYYQLGQVIQKKPKYYKYTFKEARAKMIESGHYGSWDLKTESGL
jgi:hypothetical protein